MGLQARGHEEVPRALRRRAREVRRLDLEEAVLVEEGARRLHGLVPQLDVGQHGGAAQVEIAVLEAKGLVDGRGLRGLDLEGRRLGAVQDLDGRDAHLDLAAGQVGVDRLGRARDDLAARREHVLGAHLLGERVRLGDARRVEHELHHAAAVAEIDEDEVAVVAAARDPAGEAHLAADVGGAQLARIDVAEHQDSFPRRAASSAAKPAAARSSSPPPSMVRRRTRVVAELVEAEQHRQLRAAAAGLLELALGAAPGEVQLGGQAGASQLLGDAEGGGARLVAEADHVDVGRPGRQRPVAHRKSDALEAAAPAHARRGGAADLLDEPVVAAAAADAALRAETVGVELEGGARVVVEAAHQAEVEVRLQTRAASRARGPCRSARGTPRTGGRRCAAPRRARRGSSRPCSRRCAAD